MRKTEADIECERLLFDFGKAVLGKNSGGMIKKLMQLKGISSARVVLKMAAEKSDPREYVGAVIKGKESSANAISDEQWSKIMERERERQKRTGWI